ncbi:hypothetical protein, unlikely [Trypanosoma brucei gambiense DAL972]|uniref:Uncharacterized protein n=1 Tax=Trypanosoma brucei gambiense (strain MHOM/CI/86/DAL972) TaxID=679716 RepID=D0A9R5_TRYB9|nr:hypothetical protein, unlikely [Trypanosoma brucei gambiense DAL972]CBH18416.1 hypothetical protein, unlikely [Trypanosoma brucei gambiense DAL972]|eukprot:XP_011780680.1 hypothetical protein, unlikely [Trypanosoma brucei gambiense DAL972]
MWTPTWPPEALKKWRTTSPMATKDVPRVPFSKISWSLCLQGGCRKTVTLVRPSRKHTYDQPALSIAEVHTKVGRCPVTTECAHVTTPRPKAAPTQLPTPRALVASQRFKQMTAAAPSPDEKRMSASPQEGRAPLD